MFQWNPQEGRNPFAVEYGSAKGCNAKIHQLNSRSVRVNNDNQKKPYCVLKESMKIFPTSQKYIENTGKVVRWCMGLCSALQSSLQNQSKMLQHRTNKVTALLVAVSLETRSPFA